MLAIGLNLLRDVLLVGGTLGALVLVLAALRRGNVLLFWCVLGAVSLHLGMAGFLWAAGRFNGPAAESAPAPVTITVQAAPVDIPPVVTPPKPMVSQINQGRPDGNPAVEHFAYGHNPQGTRPGAPGSGPSLPASPKPPAFIFPAYDEHGEGFTGSSEGMTPGDVTEFGTPGTGSGGNGGDGAGTPEGQPGAGGIPIGDPTGTPNGRVYFVRLKHDVGAWFAHDEGIHRLLGFMNRYFRCERHSVPMTATELRDYYRRYHQQPTFLYVYCDEAFALSTAEVSALRDYLARGGFLFLDSRPDPAIRTAVTRELDKVQPGGRLTAIPREHPINHFLFRLTQPGLGENVLDQRNYGLTRADRLQVFYTPGNFAHLYAANAPDAFDYITAQYQMGANVVLYAIRKGDANSLKTYDAASASISNQHPPVAPAPRIPPTQVHHGPSHLPTSDPAHGEEPGEIEIGHGE